eukprot:ANDGO_00394.mRNA.1 hypothetical protein
MSSPGRVRRASVSFADSSPESPSAATLQTSSAVSSSPVTAASSAVPKTLKTGDGRRKSIVLQDDEKDEVVTVRGSLFENAREEKSEMRKRLEVESSSPGKLRNRILAERRRDEIPKLLQRTNSSSSASFSENSQSPGSRGSGQDFGKSNGAGASSSPFKRNSFVQDLPPGSPATPGKGEIVNSNFSTVGMPLIKPVNEGASPSKAGAGGGVKNRKVPMSWKEFMTYILVFMVISIALVVPVSIWVAFTFLYGELITMQETMIINRALTISKAGRIGINAPSPGTAIEIKNIDNKPSVLRLSNIVPGGSGASAMSQTIQFGAYDSGQFKTGVSLKHVMVIETKSATSSSSSPSANSTTTGNVESGVTSQLQFSGGNMFLASDLVVSGEIALRGSVQIANPAATVSVAGDGTLQMKGEFLRLVNDEGSFAVRRETGNTSMSLFSIASDGSFSVNGLFKADSLYAKSGLYGTELSIEQITTQASRVYNKDGSAYMTIRTGAGYESCVRWITGKQEYRMGIGMDGKFSMQDGSSPFLLYDANGELSLLSEEIRLYYSDALTTEFRSKIGSSTMTIAAAVNSSASLVFKVSDPQDTTIVNEYVLEQTRNKSFVMSRRDKPFFVFDSANALQLTTQELNIGTDSEAFQATFSSASASSSLVLQTAAPLTAGASASLMLLHAGNPVSGNFTLLNEGQGIFKINKGADSLITIDANSATSAAKTVQINTKDFTVESPLIANFQIVSKTANAELLVSAQDLSAKMILSSRNARYEIEHVRTSANLLNFKFYDGTSAAHTVMTMEDRTSLLIMQPLTSIRGNLTVAGKGTFAGEVSIANGDKGILFGASDQETTRLYQTADFKSLRTSDSFAVEKTLAVDGNSLFNGGFVVLGDIVLENSGSAATNRKLIFGSSTSVPTNLYRSATLDSTLVTDAHLSVKGSMTIESVMQVKNSVTISGDVLLGASSARLVFTGGATDVELYSSADNTLETPNDVSIQGSLFVANDMSVDGIIYAAVNINPGYSALFTNATYAFGVQYQISGRPRIALGKDGKAFITFSFTYQTKDYVGVVHCFDTACATTRKYKVLQSDASGLLVEGRNPIGVLGPDGLMRIVFSTTSGVRIGHCADSSCKSFTAISAVLVTESAFPDCMEATITARGTLIVTYRMSSTMKIVECFDTNVICAVGYVSSATTIASVTDGPVVAVSANGDPVFAFQRASSLTVLACLMTTVACAQNQTLTTIEAGGLMPSISLTRSGFILIAHRLPNGKVQMVSCLDASCTMFYPDSSVMAQRFQVDGSRSSVRFGSDGFAAISLVSTSTSSGFLSNAVISFLHCNNDVCDSAFPQIVDQGDSTGNIWQLTDDLDMVIGSDGLPLTVFRAVNSVTSLKDIRIAHCSNVFCTPYVRR